MQRYGYGRTPARVALEHTFWRAYDEWPRKSGRGNINERALAARYRYYLHKNSGQHR